MIIFCIHIWLIFTWILRCQSSCWAWDVYIQNCSPCLSPSGKSIDWIVLENQSFLRKIAIIDLLPMAIWNSEVVLHSPLIHRHPLTKASISCPRGRPILGLTLGLHPANVRRLYFVKEQLWVSFHVYTNHRGSVLQQCIIISSSDFRDHWQ